MRTRFWTVSALAVALAAAHIAIADEPHSLLIMGAGYTGTWNTELVIANPTDSAIDIQIGGIPTPTFCDTQCPPPYPINRHLPAGGQLTVYFSDVFAGTAVQYLYVVPIISTDPLPVVRARAFEVAQPARAMELPIASYATVVARAATALDFPGAERSGTAHSNLVVAEVSLAVDAVVRLDAVTATGAVVATRTVSLAPGQAMFLGDILGTMGLEDFTGHLRVTRTAGTGIVDGALATLTNDGGFAVSAGFNP